MFTLLGSNIRWFYILNICFSLKLEGWQVINTEAFFPFGLSSVPLVLATIRLTPFRQGVSQFCLGAIAVGFIDQTACSLWLVE